MKLLLAKLLNSNDAKRTQKRLGGPRTTEFMQDKGVHNEADEMTNSLIYAEFLHCGRRKKKKHGEKFFNFI